MIFRIFLLLPMACAGFTLSSCVDTEEAETWWIPTKQLPRCDRNTPISVLHAHAVRYCGDISEQLVDEVIRELSIPGRNVLVLSSLGGETSAAIKLADFLNDRGVKLQISGICHSACAQFIIFGARELFVSQRTLVGFHYNQNVINELRGAPASEEMERLAEAELEFYRRHAVPETVLFGPIATLQPSCIAEFIDEGRQTGLRVLLSNHSYFMPDQQTFTSWYPGILASEWPSKVEISVLLERVKPGQPDRHLRVLYGSLDQSYVRPFRLPVCP